MGVGGAVEVEGGFAGLRGWLVPAWDGLVADGARPPQVPGRTGGNTDDPPLVQSYYQLGWW